MAHLVGMSGGADFAYSQARIQARHGTRLADHDWHRLYATNDVAQYLRAARDTSRARWVERLAPGMSAHAVEARLRSEWRAYVREVARFQPEAWRDAVAWTEFLVDMPIIDHLARNGVSHAWMREDTIYAPWCLTDAHERQRALEKWPLAALLREVHAGLTPLAAWLAVWRQLWPRSSSAHARSLEAVVRALDAHAASLRSAVGESSFELRTELGRRLVTLFRQSFEKVGAAITHLVLEALDFERLRAGLVRRVLVETAVVEAA
jgi:hypothetical protein